MSHQTPENAYELRNPGQERLELGTGVALVGQDRLARARGQQFGLDLEEVPGDLAFVDLRIGEGEGDR